MNEFGWERQLRTDDERLISSMREIPSVIDLPGEDELLRKRMQRKLSKVSKQPEWEFLGENDDSFDFDDFMFPDDWRDLPAAAVYDKVEALLRDWCAIYAAKLPPDNNVAGIQALCLYGHILGFAVDLVDLGADGSAALKVALCKRLAKDLDRLFGIIDAMDFDGAPVREHQARMKKARSEVLKLLFQLQHENNRD